MSCNCQEVAEKGKQKVEESFAKKLVKDYSTQAHRWFVICIIILFMWLATIGGFIRFLNQYNFESYTQDGDVVNCIHTNVGGGIYNGSEIQSND